VNDKGYASPIPDWKWKYICNIPISLCDMASEAGVAIAPNRDGFINSSHIRDVEAYCPPPPPIRSRGLLDGVPQLSTRLKRAFDLSEYLTESEADEIADVIKRATRAIIERRAILDRQVNWE
jgi:hypothetical protein